MKNHSDKLQHLFRREYVRMTAFLCRHFGLKFMEIAEDIASDTFLKASEIWAVEGIPENPEAWLFTVAKNKTRDYLRHVRVVEESTGKRDFTEQFNVPDGHPTEAQFIQDSQLAMIFAVCDPVISPESQIALALQVLCGFSVPEIAKAFLSKPETIKKRLQRARAQLRESGFALLDLDTDTIQRRLPVVLKTLYLLFNEGYYSEAGSPMVRKELCSEAIGLALKLRQNPSTAVSEVFALLALMCYQSSRLEARVDTSGQTLLFDEQDRALWDNELIQQGHYYLVTATESAEISKYHLEAGIAYWHTTDDPGKWEQILRLYDQLIHIDQSPVTLLSRCYVFSKVHGKESAIAVVENLEWESYHRYALLGYLYREIDPQKAQYYYNKALNFNVAETVRQQLQRELSQLDLP